jgi:GNAT superfamily N-acetyltransferase
LTALALRSKAHRGYSAEFMAAFAVELTLDAAEIVANRTLVAEAADLPVGFVTLVGTPPLGEIGELFVEPDHLGAKIGARLLERALAGARAEGFETITVDSDPNAEGFYVRMGARRMGVSPSASVPGRLLPRLAFDLR